MFTNFFPVENTAKKRKLKVTSTSEACIVPKIHHDKLYNVSLSRDKSALMNVCTMYSESVDNLKIFDVAISTSNRFYLFNNLNEEIIPMETGIPIN